MSKKYLLTLTLLSTVALVACSKPSQDTTEKPADKTVQTEKTKQDDSKWEYLKESTAKYLSDEEIEAIQTVGDFKNAFKSLSDAYVSDFENLIQQVPEEAQKTLEPFGEQVKTIVTDQQSMLEQQFADISDDQAIASENRDSVISMLKAARDQYKTAMETAYKQMDDGLKASK